MFYSPMSLLPSFCAFTQLRPWKVILCWRGLWWGLPCSGGAMATSAFVCCLQPSLTYLALSTAEAYHEVALSLGHHVRATLQVAALLCGNEHGTPLPLLLFLLAAPSLWLFPCLPFSEKHTGFVIWCTPCGLLCTCIDDSVLFSGAAIFSSNAL